MQVNGKDNSSVVETKLDCLLMDSIKNQMTKITIILLAFYITNYSSEKVGN